VARRITVFEPQNYFSNIGTLGVAVERKRSEVGGAGIEGFRD
jgi:hypothetical protein